MIKSLIRGVKCIKESLPILPKARGRENIICQKLGRTKVVDLYNFTIVLSYGYTSDGLKHSVHNGVPYGSDGLKHCN